MYKTIFRRTKKHFVPLMLNNSMEKIHHAHHEKSKTELQTVLNLIGNVSPGAKFP